MLRPLRVVFLVAALLTLGAGQLQSDANVMISLEVNLSDEQAATVVLRRGEEAAAAARAFCAGAGQGEACAPQVAGALRERAAERLRPSARRVFRTSVEIDGAQRAFEVLEGQHPMDAAILFCQAHASDNAGCAAQLAGAVPASATAGGATAPAKPAETEASRAATEEAQAAETEAARAAAEEQRKVEADAARAAARRAEEDARRLAKERERAEREAALLAEAELEAAERRLQAEAQAAADAERERRAASVLRFVEAAQTKVYRANYTPEQVAGLDAKAMKAYARKHKKFEAEFARQTKAVVDAEFSQEDAREVLAQYAPEAANSGAFSWW